MAGFEFTLSPAIKPIFSVDRLSGELTPRTPPTGHYFYHKSLLLANFRLTLCAGSAIAHHSDRLLKRRGGKHFHKGGYMS